MFLLIETLILNNGSDHIQRGMNPLQKLREERHKDSPDSEGVGGWTGRGGGGAGGMVSVGPIPFESNFYSNGFFFFFFFFG